MSDCVIYEGYLTPRGRAGTVKRGGVQKAAYVWAFLDNGGELTDENPWVCHTCDNPACVNPEHLYAGNPKTNVHDSLSRGRNHWRNLPACPQGHPYDEQNTYVWRGRRRCRACNTEHQRTYKLRRRMLAATVSGQS